jgi:cobalt-zinc-cadmium efflux system membrane fusion protein
MEHYAEIGTLAEGRVSSLKVRVGDRVKKGAVLALVTVPSLATTQADYLSARAAERFAKERSDRETKLLAQNLTTVHEAQQAESDVVRSSATLRADEAKLRVLGLDLPTSESAIRNAGTLALKSPLDGVVVRRDAVLGSFVRPDEIAFVVADPSELWATVNVYESDLPYFRVGSEVAIKLDALDKEITGRVALMEPHVGGASRAVQARIAIPNADGALRPGLFIRASVALPMDAAADHPLVPPGAVQPIGDGEFVFVERARGQFEVRPVRVGRRSPQVVEILDGLTRGERIAVEGGFLLRGEVTKQ